MYRPITPLLPGPPDKGGPSAISWMSRLAIGCVSNCVRLPATHIGDCFPLRPTLLRLAVRCENPLRPIDCDTQLGLRPTAAEFIATRSWMCFQLGPIDCDTPLGLLPTAAPFIAARSWMCFQLRPIDCDTQLGLLPTASDFVAARSEV